ncbi:glutaminyl-peptide cyclotransferase [Robertkochia marina]|uniref:Glutaminyl-peptide cyclotransferase n=1 Tax=Robertkochia marina TaxID=1227945 RepID=A0A4S3M3A5_9FLAO|nr:glutaminyl-peptide cyclotransferase [Robertkochia marina]THD67975.1 glutaminyl-peptide cyclotransferase [Robertkochia marina]TRZ41528.1 glutaminyl-peptide cyclotransferase [Robertkochia marina]
MFIHKILTFSILSVLAIGCGNNEKKTEKYFSLKAAAKDAKINYGESVSITLENRKNIEFDSVQYFLNDSRIYPENNAVVMTPEKLGEQDLEATIFAGEKVFNVSTSLLVLAADAPKIYTYEILNTYPHDINAFTQGLEFHDDTLYEGTGRKGKSALRKIDLESGKVLSEVALNANYFGEGITIMNNKVYQLTWQSRTGFVYDLNTFERTATFKYGKSKEGWGLTNDGTRIYMSDGTDKIWILDPETLQETDHLEIVTNTSVFNKANELEYVNGSIYANVWLKDSAMIIDAKTGAITGVIDFRGLKSKVTQHDDLDVLNGIAYHPGRQTFFVTGKNWDKIFEVQIKEKQ